MLRTINIPVRLSTVLMICLAFSSCLQTSRNDFNDSQTLRTQLATQATPHSTHEPTMLKLGQPFWIGHGKIVKAIFLPGAKQVAIAWGSGVSLNAVETGQEIWFQPAPTNLIAFDVQPRVELFAAALADGSVMIFNASNGISHRAEGAQPNAYWGDIAWSPDGQTLAFQFIGPNRADSIYLLNVASGQIRQVPHSQTSEGVIPRLSWFPDGRWLASIGDDGTLRGWSVTYEK